ncbi:MAG: isoaspartyl peptidase/L-asparaginase family protein [Phenylobacterium sp.]|uniref:isoaspartyl peptidase/L-asparaginase family protein n=1 Tax=Phenylobacterium sp. TaxID=1871053 RepID=UPI00391BB8D7
MRRIGIALVLAVAGMASSGGAQAAPKWAIVAHGGAGVIERGQLSPEQEAAYRRSMALAAEAGAVLLRNGGSALDAVEAAIKVLEDDPLFNAGRGAVFTAEGRNELDAAIMDGRTLAAGAVAGVTRTRHPIALARAVMERSPHVMLQGEGADAFSRAMGLEQADPAFFFTQRRWRSLEKALGAQRLPIPEPPPGAGAPRPSDELVHDEGKHGTVGVVALDVRGDVAAGTSTGGTTAKRWGRVGDSPVVGAGTYASNRSCAVSGTGTGEYFIRLTVAREICALVEHKGLSLQAAADQVVQRELTALGGDGGVIAVAPDGQIAWSFNTSGMYRAAAAEGRPLSVGIYKDEP